MTARELPFHLIEGHPDSLIFSDNRISRGKEERIKKIRLMVIAFGSTLKNALNIHRAWGLRMPLSVFDSVLMASRCEKEHLLLTDRSNEPQLLPCFALGLM